MYKKDFKTATCWNYKLYNIDIFFLEKPKKIIKSNISTRIAEFGAEDRLQEGNDTTPYIYNNSYNAHPT